MIIIIICACGHTVECHELTNVELFVLGVDASLTWEMRCAGRNGTCACTSFEKASVYREA